MKINIKNIQRAFSNIDSVPESEYQSYRYGQSFNAWSDVTVIEIT